MAPDPRETLQVLAARPAGPLDVAALRRRVRRRRVARATGLSVVVLLIGVVIAAPLLDRRPAEVRLLDRPPVATELPVEPDPRPQRTRTDRPASGWADLPPIPGGRRAGGEVVWTGTEVLVWGGADGRRARIDGAAYDPATGAWRAVPDAPIAGRYGPAMVWTGTEVIVWGGQRDDEPLTDGAAWDPVTNRWRRIPDAPLSPRGWVTVTWTRHGVLVWGGVRPDPLPAGNDECPPLPTLADGALYDPVGDQWTPIADAPEGRAGARAVRVGDAVVLWAGSRAEDSHCDHTETGQGLVYRPAADAWERLPEAPIAAGETVPLWTGEELLIVGRDRYGDLSSDGARYQPGRQLARGSWRRLPKRDEALGGSISAFWTGSAALAVGDEFDVVVAYDAAADAWRPLPLPQPLLPDLAQAAWTGRELIVFDHEWGAMALTPR